MRDQLKKTHSAATGAERKRKLQPPPFFSTTGFSAKQNLRITAIIISVSFSFVNTGRCGMPGSPRKTRRTLKSVVKQTTAFLTPAQRAHAKKLEILKKPGLERTQQDLNLVLPLLWNSIGQHEIFSGMTQDKFAGFARDFSLEIIPQGERMAEEGDYASKLMFLDEGSVSVYVGLNNSHETVMAAVQQHFEEKNNPMKKRRRLHKRKNNSKKSARKAEPASTPARTEEISPVENFSSPHDKHCPPQHSHHTTAPRHHHHDTETFSSLAHTGTLCCVGMSWFVLL